MGEFHRRLPKAELHVHLEGSIEPETLVELDPALSVEEVRGRYRYQGFLEFLKAYVWAIQRLRAPADYALVCRRLLERLATENVRYAEINLSVGVILWAGQDTARIFEAVAAEAARSPVQVRWIFDAVRQWEVPDAMRVAELAAERMDQGVVGFGLGGDEARGPAEKFSEVFALARRSGLRLAPHAGETTGPASVWAALALGAERIGHGIRSIEDPALVRRLRDDGIPLEISISSNVATGAVASLEDHPVRRLYDAGVPIVLNTDDPAMFHTTLAREYELAEDRLGFSRQELELLAANSFRYAFTTQPAFPS